MQRNSSIGKDENIERIPNDAGNFPRDSNIEFPSSIHNLLVSGSELLPNNTVNSWNKIKSLARLKFYGDDEQTDGETEECSRTSSDRRLKLARKLGITQAQLKLAQLVL